MEKLMRKFRNFLNTITARNNSLANCRFKWKWAGVFVDTRTNLSCSYADGKKTFLKSSMHNAYSYSYSHLSSCQTLDQVHLSLINESVMWWRTRGGGSGCTRVWFKDFVLIRSRRTWRLSCETVIGANTQWSAAQDALWGQEIRRFILPAHVQRPYPSGAVGRTFCPAGEMQSSWFSVCAYFVKSNETVWFLGSRQRPPLLSPIRFWEQIQSCLSLGRDRRNILRLISFHSFLVASSSLLFHNTNLFLWSFWTNNRALRRTGPYTPLIS